MQASPPAPSLKVASFLKHFNIMMGPHGLYQHATIREPLLSEGYCTDDNTRAVQMLARLLLLVSTPAEKEEVKQLLQQCWKFLEEAEIKPGHYYNFRTAAGEWLPQGQSDDMYARLIRVLTEIINTPEVADLHTRAEDMLRPLLERAPTMQAPRFWAEFLVAAATLPAHLQRADLIKQGHDILVNLWAANASPEWPWFEEKMVYANALLPHGVLSSLKYHQSAATEDILHQSADFLMTTTIKNDMFIPIGSNGWYPKGGTPSHDNQQAIEAGTMFDFLLAYHAAFPDRVSRAQLAAPYLWFFGHNTNGVVMADEASGACLDGLFVDRVNPNYGAESMLAYQWAEILLRGASPALQQYIQSKKQ